jgi:hypothetical protein
MSVTTDKDGIAVVKTKTQHSCNFEKTERKLKAQPLCVRVLRKSALKKMQERDKTIVEKKKKKLWKRPGHSCIFSSPCQRQCELLPSLCVRRLLTFHILIFSSETP